MQIEVFQSKLYMCWKGIVLVGLKEKKKRKDIHIFRCEIYRLWKVNDT